MAKPQLHFAHANGIPSACYRVFLEALGQDYDVRSVPSLGTDGRFPITKGWGGVADQVVDSIRTRCTEPVVAVGHSLGAVTSFMTAFRHPELVTKVVLLDPPIFDGAAGFAFRVLDALGQGDRLTPARKSAGRRDRWPSRQAAGELLRNKGMFRAFDQECFDDYLAHGLVDDGDEVTLSIPVATELALFRTPLVRFSEFRGGAKVPMALVAGSKSEIAEGGRLERFSKRHGIDYGTFEGGHMFPLERPREAAARVLDTLNRLS